ncbi:MAG TPA: hypothetical protein VFD38_03320 [Myxococcaceae bacterium]|nr:hypothetical protein [Myxococcaceae bacterium]
MGQAQGGVGEPHLAAGVSTMSPARPCTDRSSTPSASAAASCAEAPRSIATSARVASPTRRMCSPQPVQATPPVRESAT